MKSRIEPLILFILILYPLSANATVYDEFRGIRSSGMGGTHRAIGTSNDTLLLNPAGMAMLSRYSVELDYSYTKREDLTRTHLSVVDSKSSPVSAGIGYTYVKGDNDNTNPTMHFLYFGAAYRISDSIAFGLTSKNFRGEFTPDGQLSKYDIYTGDLGLQIRLGDSLSVGLAYHNLLETDLPELTPPTIGAGAAFRWQELVLAFDLDADITNSDKPEMIYKAGAEYFYNRIAPIRIGYTKSPFVRKTGEKAEEDIISAGMGYLSQTGSLDIAFSRSVQRARNWTLIGGIKFFL